MIFSGSGLDVRADEAGYTFVACVGCDVEYPAAHLSRDEARRLGLALLAATSQGEGSPPCGGGGYMEAVGDAFRREGEGS